MYDYNRYMNNGYNSNIIQAPPTPQYQVQCFFVNSKDEAMKNVVKIKKYYTEHTETML